MAFKSRITKQIEKETKQSKKENKEMNKAKIITLTVLITLAVLAAIGGIFYLGAQYGMQVEQGISERVTSEIKAVTVTTDAPTPSK